MRIHFALVLAVATMALSPLFAFADTQFLFYSGNDTKSGWRQVSITTNHETGAVEGLSVGNDFYSIDDIKKGANIHIDGVDDKHRAITLSGSNIDLMTSADLNLRCLNDGTKSDSNKSKYFNYPLKLKRDKIVTKDGDTEKVTYGKWKVYLPGNPRPLASIYMYTKSMVFVGTIGIDRIEPKLATLNVNRLLADSGANNKIALAGVDDEANQKPNVTDSPANRTTGPETSTKKSAAI